jgi:hypothetical protein
LVRDTVWAAAQTVMPDVLELGMTHGDFAMRNIVVEATQRVTVLDTLARFRAPIYRDVGYFIADLQIGRVSALVRGVVLRGGRCDDYRRAFLRGFHGESGADTLVRLYEVQALLERWASIVAHGLGCSPAVRNLWRVLMYSLASGVFKRAIEASLGGIVAAPVAPGPVAEQVFTLAQESTCQNIHPST